MRGFPEHEVVDSVPRLERDKHKGEVSRADDDDAEYISYSYRIEVVRSGTFA